MSHLNAGWIPILCLRFKAYKRLWHYSIFLANGCCAFSNFYSCSSKIYNNCMVSVHCDTQTQNNHCVGSYSNLLQINRNSAMSTTQTTMLRLKFPACTVACINYAVACFNVVKKCSIVNRMFYFKVHCKSLFNNTLDWHKAHVKILIVILTVLWYLILNLKVFEMY